METCNKTFIINKLIEENHLQSYLEIGNSSNPLGHYLQIKCALKTLVDPLDDLSYITAENSAQWREFVDFKMPSTAYFEASTTSFDLIFINGVHTHERSLADLKDALDRLTENGFIVLQNTCPESASETSLESLRNQKPYTGEVWKTAVSAIQAGYDVRTFPFDWGITVIKKTREVRNLQLLSELDFSTDFSLESLRPVFDTKDLRNPLVSYFTPLYNTDQKQIERTVKTVLNQTNPNWEWVVLDDSDTQNAQRLRLYFESLDEPRIHYYRMTPQSGGFIGKVKKRACALCTGDFFAELDHDDLLMPDLTDKILMEGSGYDFIYTNYSSVQVAEDASFAQGEHYGDGFAMGYGAYRTTKAIHPLTGFTQTYEESIAVPINPKTIRHIVGVPNHLRCWRADFYWEIGGHCENLYAVDDYELIVRSLIAKGKFLHLDYLGYLQTYHETNTTDARRDEIQVLVAAVLAANDKKIKATFESLGMTDWAYDYFHKNFPQTSYQYWLVPTEKMAESYNQRVGVMKEE
ncbi:MAG: glycosyltransferase [Streptococcaceae bacterium]|jgi:hypothetical protein|nr:glycosyltransferase [Streptococcaceae bacterium]